MKIVVQKFGGTSVVSKESRQHCFKHIKHMLREGYKVVVVVSAMGRDGAPYATDTLISLAPSISEREKDMLLNTGELISACVFSSELNELGIQNRVLSGGQAGIITNSLYNNAGIIELRPERIFEELKKVDVIVVTGFQGVAKNNDITTLGRGGSDTSATALAASINADVCDIFTDVEGIMTADPRIVTEAQILESTTYAEISNLAHMGAKVIHPRAVEIAMQANIPIRVRSTFSDTTGTLISNKSEMDAINEQKAGRFLTGITQTSDIVQFSVASKISYEMQNQVFEMLADSGVSIDLINITTDNLCFTINKADQTVTTAIFNELDIPFDVNEDVTKISLVGANITGVPGVVRKIVSTLFKEGIPILQTTDSHTTIWVLVPNHLSSKAIQSLHKAFELDKPLTR